MTHLEDDLYFSTTQDIINKKKYFTINTVKLSFVKKASSMFCPVKRHLKYIEATQEVLSTTKIQSVLTIKILAVEQVDF